MSEIIAWDETRRVVHTKTESDVPLGFVADIETKTRSAERAIDSILAHTVDQWEEGPAPVDPTLDVLLDYAVLP